MYKLNKEEIKQLPVGRSVQNVVLTRLYDPKPVTIYTGEAPVLIQKRESPFKRGKQFRPAGEITLITVPEVPGTDPVQLSANVAIANNWAEAGEDDIEQDGSIVVEDYLMEIYGE